MKICFYDTKPYDKIWFEPAAKEKGFEITFQEVKLNKDTAILATGYDAVCIFVNDTADEETIKILSDCGVQAILLRCAGFNNVNIKEAEKHAIKVLHVPSYSPSAIAEYTMGLILAVNRKIHRAYVRTRDFNFSINGLMGFDLNGRTAGVIGTGKIGQEMIRILKGFNMKILAYDVYPNDQLDVEYVPLETLFSKADVITLHCPLTKETRHIINKDSIKKMKDGVILVNTSRGALVHTDSLLSALAEGKFSGVALDVYEEEDGYFFEDCSNELITDSDLIHLTSYRNVILTSHQAFFTKEAMEAIARVTIENADLLNRGKNLTNLII
jgi:D-lactate dehydrogenase